MAPLIHKLSKGFGFISSNFDLNDYTTEKSKSALILIKLKVYVTK